MSKRAQLTERDIDALVWIAQQYTITLDHLSILLARLIEPGAYTWLPKEAGKITEKRAMAIVLRWERLGIVRKTWLFRGDPAWISLTNEGLRFVADQRGERPFPPFTPSIGSDQRHLYQINFTRLYIEGKRKDAQWTSERELKSEQPITTGKKPHPPDAIVTTNEHTNAIEVELSQKKSTRLDNILKELAEDQNYHTIWYFCKGRANTVIHNGIQRLTEEYQQRFLVYDLDELSLSCKGGNDAARPGRNH
jgi:hypothetical protein